MVWRNFEKPAAFNPDIYRSILEELPKLDWISVDLLRFNQEYRPDRKTNQLVVASIAADFDWAKFHPLIVARAGDGQFDIIDGQRRARAATMIGIWALPCSIVRAVTTGRNAIFEVLNPTRPAYRPAAGHRARLSSGDESAAYVDAICKAADISISYNRSAKQMKPGETNSVIALYEMFDIYGYDAVVVALKVLRHCAGEKIGLIRSETIRAFCSSICRNGNQIPLQKLIEIFKKIDLQSEIKYLENQTKLSKDTRWRALSTAIDKYLLASA